jgi:hypothetical protein
MDYLQKLKKLEDETPKTNKEWLTAWRELAQVTNGMTADDPRFESVMCWLNVCDVAFSIDSWPRFQEAAAEVKRVMQATGKLSK